jgi:hypothetical protein
VRPGSRARAFSIAARWRAVEAAALARRVADLEGGDQQLALGEARAGVAQRAREALGVVGVAVGHRVGGGEQHAQRRVARAGERALVGYGKNGEAGASARR